jgi:hypothetical protein
MTYVATTLGAILGALGADGNAERPLPPPAADDAAAGPVAGAGGPAPGVAPSDQENARAALAAATSNSMHALFQFSHKVERSLEQLAQSILSALCAAHFACEMARELKVLYVKTAGSGPVVGVDETLVTEKEVLRRGYLARIISDHARALEQYRSWHAV